MTRNDVDTFEKLKAQLDGLHQELSILAKKSPNDAVNEFKIKLINITLSKCNQLLGKKYLPFIDFEAFSLDEMPSNSDVTFIISQYIECAEKFRSDHIYEDYGWYWKTDGRGDPIPTSQPRKLLAK